MEGVSDPYKGYTPLVTQSQDYPPYFNANLLSLCTVALGFFRSGLQADWVALLVAPMPPSIPEQEIRPAAFQPIY